MKEILAGKVKTVYDCDGDAGKVLIEFHDKVTAGNGRLVEFPEEKGKVCCLISALLFEKLSNHGIRSHYIDPVTGAKPTRGILNFDNQVQQALQPPSGGGGGGVDIPTPQPSGDLGQWLSDKLRRFKTVNLGMPTDVLPPSEFDANKGNGSWKKGGPF